MRLNTVAVLAVSLFISTSAWASWSCSSHPGFKQEITLLENATTNTQIVEGPGPESGYPGTNYNEARGRALIFATLGSPAFDFILNMPGWIKPGTSLSYFSGSGTTKPMMVDAKHFLCADFSGGTVTAINYMGHACAVSFTAHVTYPSKVSFEDIGIYYGASGIPSDPTSIAPNTIGSGDNVSISNYMVAFNGTLYLKGGATPQSGGGVSPDRKAFQYALSGGSETVATVTLSGGTSCTPTIN